MPSLGRTAARGYGVTHKRLRAKWARLVEAGDAWCARCGGWIAPGSLWDLGHDDHDRGLYNGPEHRRCNRAAGARKLNAMRRRRSRFKGSRVW